MNEEEFNGLCDFRHRCTFKNYFHRAAMSVGLRQDNFDESMTRRLYIIIFYCDVRRQSCDTMLFAAHRILHYHSL